MFFRGRSIELRTQNSLRDLPSKLLFFKNVDFFVKFDDFFQMFFTTPDAITFLGLILGEAGLRGEALLDVKQTDVSCMNELGGIVSSFGIEEKFQGGQL